MSIFTELENPPKSRRRDLVIGAILGIVLSGALVWIILPALTGIIVGSSKAFDRDLRQKDAYMQAICTDVIDVDRDQNLCGCVLATEVPSLDCQTNFLHWSLERYIEACSAPETGKQSLTFCSCLTTIEEQLKTAQQPEQNRQTLEKLYRCMELDDAFALPSIEELRL